MEVDWKHFISSAEETEWLCYCSDHLRDEIDAELRLVLYPLSSDQGAFLCSAVPDARGARNVGSWGGECGRDELSMLLGYFLRSLDF